MVSGGVPSAPDPSMALPRPASTVVLLRPGDAGAEVLLTHRPATMAFGAGLHVFPGGAVEPRDRDLANAARVGVDVDACASSWAGDLALEDAVGHAIAAIRELYEEAGVLLAERPGGEPPDAAEVEAAHARGETLAALVDRLGLRLRADRLVPLSRWVTPPIEVARRYDTRFFVADAADGTGFRLDPREVAGHAWMRPADAIDGLRAGRIDLWPPTATTLREVQGADCASEVHARLAPAAAGVPAVEPIAPGVLRVRLFGAGGLIGRSLSAYLVGRERVVVVDPGDPNEPGVSAILDAVAAMGGAVAAIALTSPDPGHMAGVTAIARRGGVPVLAGQGVGAEVASGVRTLGDGERVTEGDLPMRALATPGPDAGHLAFDVPSAGVVLTGDLDDAGAATRMASTLDRGAREQSQRVVAALGVRRRLGAHE